MSYPLTFHPQATKEYMEGYQWYERQRRGLGERFEKMVEQRLQQISATPEHYKMIKAPYRQVVVAIFPYVIVYKFNKRKKQIYIAAVYHTSRHPKYKFRK